jgi:hypothetical protein
MSNIVRKPLTDKELLLRILCMSEHDFDLDRARIELEPSKFFWRAACVQARAQHPHDFEIWAERLLAFYGWVA